MGQSCNKPVSYIRTFMMHRRYECYFMKINPQIGKSRKQKASLSTHLASRCLCKWTSGPLPANSTGSSQRCPSVNDEMSVWPIKPPAITSSFFSKMFLFSFFPHYENFVFVMCLHIQFPHSSMSLFFLLNRTKSLARHSRLSEHPELFSSPCFPVLLHVPLSLEWLICRNYISSISGGK